MSTPTTGGAVLAGIQSALLGLSLTTVTGFGGPALALTSDRDDCRLFDVLPLTDEPAPGSVAGSYRRLSFSTRWQYHRDPASLVVMMLDAPAVEAALRSLPALLAALATPVVSTQQVQMTGGADGRGSALFDYSSADPKVLMTFTGSIDYYRGLS